MADEKRIQERWQSQPLAESEIDMERIVKAASKFQRQIRARNVIEYAAGGVLLVWSAHAALLSTAPPLVKAGMVLMGLGALVVMSVLSKRGHAGEPPFAAPSVELVAWHRSELARQRDLLRRVPLWYLAPFVPGVLAVIAGRWLETPEQPLRAAAALATVALVFLAVAALNWAAARKLDRKIRELEQGLLG